MSGTPISDALLTEQGRLREPLDRMLRTVARWAGVAAIPAPEATRLEAASGPDSPIATDAGSGVWKDGLPGRPTAPGMPAGASSVGKNITPFHVATARPAAAGAGSARPDYAPARTASADLSRLVARADVTSTLPFLSAATPPSLLSGSGQLTPLDAPLDAPVAVCTPRVELGNIMNRKSRAVETASFAARGPAGGRPAHGRHDIRESGALDRNRAAPNRPQPTPAQEFLGATPDAFGADRIATGTGWPPQLFFPRAPVGW
jgi:hypothetical protein